MSKKTSDEVILEMYHMMKSIESSMVTKDDIAVVAARLDDIDTLLDKQSELLDRDEIERQALCAQVGRHDDWIANNSPKIETLYRAV